MSQQPRHIPRPRSRADGKKSHGTVSPPGLQHDSYCNRWCLHYSLSLSIFLSPCLAHVNAHTRTHTRTHTKIDIWMARWVPADIRPSLGIRHASLSETAAVSLITSSVLGLMLTVGALIDPGVFSSTGIRPMISWRSERTSQGFIRCGSSVRPSLCIFILCASLGRDSSTNISKKLWVHHSFNMTMCGESGNPITVL